MTKKAQDTAATETEAAQEEPTCENCENMQQENEAHKEKMLRAMADLQNVRRRADEDRVRLPQLGAEKIALSLLPVLDNLELAMKNMPAEKNDWMNGVENIFTGMLTALQNEGLETIAETDVAVNPEKHEVLMADPEGKPGMVSSILQTGYSLKGKVIRAAKVTAGAQ
jgi:molecular chaperone GrpE